MFISKGFDGGGVFVMGEGSDPVMNDSGMFCSGA